MHLGKLEWPHCDLTGMMVGLSRFIPKWPYFRSVNYSNLPANMYISQLLKLGQCLKPGSSHWELCDQFPWWRSKTAVYPCQFIYCWLPCITHTHNMYLIYIYIYYMFVYLFIYFIYLFIYLYIYVIIYIYTVDFIRFPAIFDLDMLASLCPSATRRGALVLAPVAEASAGHGWDLRPRGSHGRPAGLQQVWTQSGLRLCFCRASGFLFDPWMLSSSWWDAV